VGDSEGVSDVLGEAPAVSDAEGEGETTLLPVSLSVGEREGGGEGVNEAASWGVAVAGAEGGAEGLQLLLAQGPGEGRGLPDGVREGTRTDGVSERDEAPSVELPVRVSVGNGECVGVVLSESVCKVAVVHNEVDTEAVLDPENERVKLEVVWEVDGLLEKEKECSGVLVYVKEREGVAERVYENEDVKEKRDVKEKEGLKEVWDLEGLLETEKEYDGVLV
jgi:hypothetical protein